MRGGARQIPTKQTDLIVLDVMLPDGSGLDLCRELWTMRSTVPIILLTALQEDVERITGLEIGADDYLGKPFNPRELLARIRSVLRRGKDDCSAQSETGRHLFEGVLADPFTRTVTDAKGGEVELTGAEFDPLLTVLDRPGRALSRDQLLDLARRRDGDVLDRSIDVLISRPRRKLSKGDATQIIKTVRNGGYQLAVRSSIWVSSDTQVTQSGMHLVAGVRFGIWIV